MMNGENVNTTGKNYFTLTCAEKVVMGNCSNGEASYIPRIKEGQMERCGTWHSSWVPPLMPIAMVIW